VVSCAADPGHSISGHRGGFPAVDADYQAAEKVESYRENKPVSPEQVEKLIDALIAEWVEGTGLKTDGKEVRELKVVFWHFWRVVTGGKLDA